jgi:hypothetical protein
MASNMGLTGSEFHTEGPPAKTTGSSSDRSSARRGMPARSRASTMLVHAISCARVNPTTSNEATGDDVSSERRGIPSSRMRSAMSTQGRKPLSHDMPSWRLMAW